MVVKKKGGIMLYNVYCRVYQKVLKTVSPFLNWHEPEILEGVGAVEKIAQEANKLKIKHFLIVTDKVLVKLGLLTSLTETLKEESILYSVYDGTVPNPTLTNVQDALEIYLDNNCDGIIAFGGGSSMDCAKGVGVKIAMPNKRLEQMEGVLKVKSDMPPFFAVPTTSGTGSECTVAAVLTDENTHRKFAINDTHLIPHYAVLDPELTIGLPAQITAETGMDTLTHAVEAYIGGSNTNMTKKNGRRAVKRVFKVLHLAYKDGKNLNARAEMQKAAYYGGLAFTRAYIGYVHAMAHQLGGYYQVPHGRANAIILPYVLEHYGSSIHKQLAELADLVHLTNENVSDEVKANMFIQAIRDLNRSMGILDKIPELKKQDIPELSKRARKEGNPLYPVPAIWKQEDFEYVYSLMEVRE